MNITNLDIKQYEDIADDCWNGNWTDATNKCIKYNYCVVELIEIYEHRQQELDVDNELLSMTDIAYLGMYIERARNAKL